MFYQLAFRLKNSRVNPWQLEMVMSTAHRLKKVVLLGTHQYLNLPVENLSVGFAGRLK